MITKTVLERSGQAIVSKKKKKTKINMMYDGKVFGG